MPSVTATDKLCARHYYSTCTHDVLVSNISWVVFFFSPAVMKYNDSVLHVHCTDCTCTDLLCCALQNAETTIT